LNDEIVNFKIMLDNDSMGFFFPLTWLGWYYPIMKDSFPPSISLSKLLQDDLWLIKLCLFMFLIFEIF
jgi:hypothetical protein